MKLVSLWAPVVAFMGLLYLASSRSMLPTEGNVSDKFVHVAAYFVLGCLVLRAVHGGVRTLRPAPTLIAFLLTVAYGVSDELHQTMVPDRVASVADGVADALGAALSVLLMGLVGALRERRVAIDR